MPAVASVVAVAVVAVAVVAPSDGSRIHTAKKLKEVRRSTTLLLSLLPLRLVVAVEDLEAMGSNAVCQQQQQQQHPPLKQQVLLPPNRCVCRHRPQLDPTRPLQAGCVLAKLVVGACWLKA
jgi:hypothetical protein